MVQAAQDLLRELPRRQQQLLSLIEELQKLWADPEERIRQVSSTDAALMEELQGAAGDGFGEGETPGEGDTASEYSAMTQGTQQSILSIRSDRSDSSRRSGTSTVSVLSALSNLTQQTDKSDASAAARSSSSSSFSIKGLDHALLSRGEAAPVDSSKQHRREQRIYKRDQSERRQKRIQRSKTKGASRDVWGLRREAALCLELLAYAHVHTVAHATQALIEALLLLPTSMLLNGGGGGRGGEGGGLRGVSNSDRDVDVDAVPGGMFAGDGTDDIVGDAGSQNTVDTTSAAAAGPGGIGGSGSGCGSSSNRGVVGDGAEDGWALAGRLQAAVSAYVLFVQTHPPPVAPAYPAEWLRKRAMGSVLHYQDPRATLARLVGDIQLESSGKGNNGRGSGGNVQTASSAAAHVDQQSGVVAGSEGAGLVGAVGCGGDAVVGGFIAGSVAARVAGSAGATAALVARTAEAMLQQQHTVSTWWSTAASGIREWSAIIQKISLRTTD